MGADMSVDEAPNLVGLFGIAEVDVERFAGIVAVVGREEGDVEGGGAENEQVLSDQLLQRLAHVDRHAQERRTVRHTPCNAYM